MINKCVFNGNDWLVTSGEIEITPLHGTRPMHPALSKKLYDQNAPKYKKLATLVYTGHTSSGIPYIASNQPKPYEIIPGLNAPAHKDIAVNITAINKYTIVELTHNNKHYHGLASRADCDKENAVTGIAVAYHRAFEKMVDVFKIGVATYDENSPKMQGSSPSTVVLDDAVDLPAKKWKETWATKKFDSSTYRQSLNRFSEDKNPGIVFPIKSGKKVTK